MNKTMFFVTLGAAALAGCCSCSSGSEESAKILATARKVADSYLDRNPYQTAHPKDKDYVLFWEWGTLWWGVTKLGLEDRTSDCLDRMLKFGEDYDWEWKRAAPVGYHADSHCIGQAYLDLALAGITDKGAKKMRELEDEVAFRHPVNTDPLVWPAKGVAWDGVGGIRRWKWCDTLFMAPTVFVRMTKWTGDPKYWKFADDEFRALTEYLFSEQYGFYFRDSRFFDKKSPNGMPLFWSRGNGWVFAALANILENMPADWPTRDWYVKLYRTMAKSVQKAQVADGTWHVNLLDPADGGNEPEMSGTCLYLYGYLWGFNNGLLDPAEFGETVEKGWTAVMREVKPDGRIGHMQKPASAPGAAGKDEEQPYGVGAFLGAAVEMAKYRGRR